MGYRIPIDTAAVDPATFVRFVPPADRPDIAALGEGAAILGATSATVRGLGPGSVLNVAGHELRVAAVLPDQLVGAAELVVRTARAQGSGCATTDTCSCSRPPGGG